MINIRKGMCIFLVGISVALNGCGKKENDENRKLDLYNLPKGKSIAKDYLERICNNDISGANELCSEELLKSNKNLEQGVSSITSYQMEKTIEGNDFSYFIFNVIRSSTLQPKSDLETYTIKIARDGENYAIDDIKAKSQKELFVKNNGLRIIGEDGGKSNLIINLNNFPKDAYQKENKIMLYKDKVPTESFGKVVLGFKGQRVAITTKDKDSPYIGIAVIDDSLMEIASIEAAPADAGNEGNSEGTQNMQGYSETPIISELISVDLLKNSEIEKMVFSGEDTMFAVNYKNNNGISRTNIYRSDDGSLVDTDFDKEFPKDKYNIIGKNFEGDKFNFKVTSNNDDKNKNGQYEINLRTLELKKL